MGLAASQARLLTITSRLSSVELKQQQIAMSEMILAKDQEEISNKYSEAIGNKKLVMANGQNTADLTYELLQGAGYSVMRTNDKTTANSADDATADEKALSSQLKNSQFLSQGLISGYLTLVDDSGNPVSLSSATKILEMSDTSDDAEAEAEYNAAMAKINRKEKALTQEAKKYDTEYSSLTNELQSIQSIISDHASKDFQLFS